MKNTFLKDPIATWSPEGYGFIYLLAISLLYRPLKNKRPLFHGIIKISLHVNSLLRNIQKNNSWKPKNRF